MKHLTVYELIDLLQKMPKHLPVCAGVFTILKSESIPVYNVMNGNNEYVQICCSGIDYNLKLLLNE